MVTTAPPNLLWLANEWEDAIQSAVFAGIVADELHDAPSKHKSYNDNPAGSWPRSHPKDKEGPRTRACAIDVRMSLADMKLVHGRYRGVFNDITDSRRKYIAAFNGWDGQGRPGRYNLITMTVSETDSSHGWHEHVELFYTYVGDDAESWRGARANLSIVRGWSDAMWLASETEDDVSVADVTNALSTPQPWQSTGVANLAKTKGWGDKISTRALMEYIFSATTLEGPERHALLLAKLTEISNDPGNDVVLTSEQIMFIAEQLTTALPDPQQIAAAVAGETARRLAE